MQASVPKQLVNWVTNRGDIGPPVPSMTEVCPGYSLDES